MIKDIFLISASDVNVEQLFNTAWDVCHYHQNHLNVNTIEIIMLVKWYEKLRFLTLKQELSQNSDQETDADELSMNEWFSVAEDENHYEIDWKTESEKSEKSEKDDDN